MLWAAKLLGLNYPVSGVELSALQVLANNSVPNALLTMLDLPDGLESADAEFVDREGSSEA